MYDTFCFSSPFLDEESIGQIQSRLMNMHYGYTRTREGMILHDFLRGQIFCDRAIGVIVDVKRKRMSWEGPTVTEILRDAGSGRRHPGRTVYRECPPFITVEGSVHKMLLGHNVTGGPREFQPAAAWFTDEIASRMGVPLPETNAWTVNRIDYADTFTLPERAIGHFIESAGKAVYPRRKVTAYGRKSICCSGKGVTVKMYDKGAEFRKHDMHRLREELSSENLECLLKVANQMLRIECTIRAGKLRKDLNLNDRYPLVSEIYDEHIMAIHYDEVFKLLKEGRFKEFPVVRRPGSVCQRLSETYTQVQADRLYQTWVMLVKDGETVAKKTMKPSTWSDHQRKLIQAGCAWLGANMDSRRCTLPEGFSISPTDSRCCLEEDPIVISKLAPYR